MWALALLMRQGLAVIHMLRLDRYHLETWVGSICVLLKAGLILYKMLELMRVATALHLISCAILKLLMRTDSALKILGIAQ